MQEPIVFIIVVAACCILYARGIPPLWKYRFREILSRFFLFLHARTLAMHIAPKRKPTSPYPACHGCSGCTTTSEKPLHFVKPPRKHN